MRILFSSLVVLTLITTNALALEPELSTLYTQLQSLNNAMGGKQDERLGNAQSNYKLCRIGSTIIELADNQNIIAPEFNVSAIVNAANEECLGGGGIDGAITQAGGKKLAEARKNLSVVHDSVRCPTGQARLTISGNISNAQFVIHAVGPRCSGSTIETKELALITSAYKNSLEIIQDWNTPDPVDQLKRPEFAHISRDPLHAIRSVAFPTISGGIFGCAPTALCKDGKTVAEHVLAAIADYLTTHKNHGIKHIVLVFFEPEKEDKHKATANFLAYAQALEVISKKYGITCT